ncbi:MAG: hypothetical protein CMG41_00440 [Candidatus Marinimicrobia bacterium]|jgi:hypothetical protein|nr:hypothetical protein [Candidatus Neomarinimicrobiota bacterium]|tara:strand:+ start:350 stop:580 length:231 start_codon:yes stop_codon:yes gene_type:complete
MLTDTFIGPSGRSFVFKLISIGSSLILPNISLRGTSIFISSTLISTPHIPSGSFASIPMVTISLQVAPSWGKVITQ